MSDEIDTYVQALQAEADTTERVVDDLPKVVRDLRNGDLHSMADDMAGLNSQLCVHPPTYKGRSPQRRRETVGSSTKAARSSWVKHQHW